MFELQVLLLIVLPLLDDWRNMPCRVFELQVLLFRMLLLLDELRYMP